MSAASYNRGSKKLSEDIGKELNINTKALVEALVHGEIRRKKRDEWRQKAMSFMVESYFFKQLEFHMSSRRSCQTKRNVMLTAHTLWIDANGEIELNNASHNRCPACRSQQLPTCQR